MGKEIVLIGVIVLVATITSVVFVLQVQKRHYATLSIHQAEWENVQKRSQQIWEIQQEKRAIELDHSLTTHVQHVERAWKVWEANDTSLIASTAEQHNTALMQIQLEKELTRLPYMEDIPLE